MKFLLALSMVALCAADLRMASQPKNKWKTQQRNRRGSAKFITPYAVYMEPSAFDYNGLDNQRKNAYDNFLRSNIDNEQDRRNFNNEQGKDHLPFRTMETGALDNLPGNDIQRELQANNAAGDRITATPGTPVVIPLRWNNPHAAELEVNVWITQGAYKTAPIVVPVKKPTCSGEGHQDNAFGFTIPTDFLKLGQKVPNFTGCKALGDCVLQTYAHSVESRMYAIGTPLIVTGDMDTTNPATNANQIESANPDNGLNLATLKDLCLPSNDPTADIQNAVPRQARLMSDVFNHAFQNSDYSAYSGQQPEAISKQMQASAIIKQTAANRGELGKRLLAKENAAGAKLAAKILQASGKLIKKFEGVTNRIIDRIGNQQMQTTGAVPGTAQQMAKCFRCDQGGSTVVRRLKTNTYVPSFELPAAQVAAAKNLIQDKKYKHLINDKGQLQIYTTVLTDMEAQYIELGKLGLGYQPAVVKGTTATMGHVTDFKKRNARGRTDGGNYAATEAKKTKPEEIIFTPNLLQMGASGLLVMKPEDAADKQLFTDAFAAAFVAAGDGDVAVPDTGADDQGVAFVDGVAMIDGDALNADVDCDADEFIEAWIASGKELDDLVCSTPQQLFTPTADTIEDPGDGTAPVGVAGGVSPASATKASGFVFAGVLAMVALLF